MKFNKPSALFNTIVTACSIVSIITAALGIYLFLRGWLK